MKCETFTDMVVCSFALAVEPDFVSWSFGRVLGQLIDLLHEERKLVRLAIAGPSNGLNPMLPFWRNCRLMLTG